MPELQARFVCPSEGCGLDQYAVVDVSPLITTRGVSTRAFIRCPSCNSRNRITIKRSIAVVAVGACS